MRYFPSSICEIAVPSTPSCGGQYSPLSVPAGAGGIVRRICNALDSGISSKSVASNSPLLSKSEVSPCVHASRVGSSDVIIISSLTIV